MEDYITTKEAAEMLDINLMSVSRLIRKGVLKGEKFGPVWMVERASVEAYAEATEGKGPHDPTRKVVGEWLTPGNLIDRIPESSEG